MAMVAGICTGFPAIDPIAALCLPLHFALLLAMGRARLMEIATNQARRHEAPSELPANDSFAKGGRHVRSTEDLVAFSRMQNWGTGGTR